MPLVSSFPPLAVKIQYYLSVMVIYSVAVNCIPFKPNGPAYASNYNYHEGIFTRAAHQEPNDVSFPPGKRNVYQRST